MEQNSKKVGLVIASLTGAFLGTFLKVWLVFWSIDQLFHYRIEFFDGWNLLAGYILVSFLSPKNLIQIVGVKKNEAR
jgi:hypothetical protein